MQRTDASKARIVKRFSASAVSHLVGEIERRIEPSIRLYPRRVRDTDLPLGASRLAGVPDVPRAFEWPTVRGDPLRLIAQVNLQDLRAFDAARALPSAGWLYFFYDVDGPGWGYDPRHRDCWRVIHVEGEAEELERIPRSQRRRLRGFRMCAVDFTPEITLPDATILVADGVFESTSEEWRAYCEVFTKLCPESQAVHRLLGQPDLVQSDMRLECQLASHGVYCGNATGDLDPRRAVLEAGARDWVLLLQVDTDPYGPGWMWGDCGRVYYVIRERDLAARDFDQVWLVLQAG